MGLAIIRLIIGVIEPQLPQDLVSSHEYTTVSDQDMLGFGFSQVQHGCSEPTCRRSGSVGRGTPQRRSAGATRHFLTEGQ